LPTQIAFSGQGGDFIIVEEDPDEVARRLGESHGLVAFQRIPAPISEEPIATWINPARVAFLMEPVLRRAPRAKPGL
jgi:hypothetical protein